MMKPDTEGLMAPASFSLCMCVKRKPHDLTCTRTCSRPSSVLWMVTHLLGWTPLVVTAVMSESSSSFFSFSFFTRLSMARLAKPSLSAPCRWHIRLWTMLRQASALLLGGGPSTDMLTWQEAKGDMTNQLIRCDDAAEVRQVAHQGYKTHRPHSNRTWRGSLRQPPACLRLTVDILNKTPDTCTQSLKGALFYQKKRMIYIRSN